MTSPSHLPPQPLGMAAVVEVLPRDVFAARLGDRVVVGRGGAQPSRRKHPDPRIPAGELLFFPLLPVRVDEAKLAVGEEATGAVMTVTSSRLVVESALSRHNDIQLVYAHNDPGAHGAYLAAQAAGRAQGMKFIGIDGLHPTESGYTQIAQVWFEAIQLANAARASA